MARVWLWVWLRSGDLYSGFGLVLVFLAGYFGRGILAGYFRKDILGNAGLFAADMAGLFAGDGYALVTLRLRDGYASVTLWLRDQLFCD